MKNATVGSRLIRLGPLFVVGLCTASPAGAVLVYENADGLPASPTENLTVLSDLSLINISGTGTIRIQGGNLILFDGRGTLDAKFDAPQLGQAGCSPQALKSGCGFVKLGDGVLTLTNGGNAFIGYTGTTAVRSGTLALAGNIFNSAASFYDISGTLDISQIKGSQLGLQGGLEDLGNPGTIALGNKTLRVVGLGESLESQTPASPVFDGVITDGGIAGGTGGNFTVGGGTQVLAGVNTYTGVTTTEAGGTLGLRGQGSIEQSRLFQNGGTFSIADISGPPDDFGFPTRLDVATVKNIVGPGEIQLGTKTLVIAQADGEISGPITSACSGLPGANCGSVDKRGPGTLTLSGTNTFNGSFNVSEGTLNLPGSVAAATTVFNGATLKGNGSIVNDLNNNGTVAPGNSVGTITVTGNYLQGPTGTYIVEIRPDGSANDLIAVTGSASLAGQLSATGESGQALTPAAAGKTYTILTADGGVSGQFAGNARAVGAYTFQTFYNPNDVQLGVTYNGFASVAPGAGNPASVAQTLDRVPVNTSTGFSSGNADFDSILTGLAVQNSDQLNRSLNSIIAEPYAAFLTLQLGQNQYFADSILNRAQLCSAHRRGWKAAGLTPEQASRNANVSYDCPDEKQPSAWVDFISTSGNIDGSDGLSGYDYRYTGMVMGADMQVATDTTLGIAFGYSQPKLDHYQLADAKIDGDTYFISAYGSYTPDRWEFNALLGYNYGTYDGKRNINFDAVNRTAKSDFDGQGWIASTRAAYHFDVETLDIAPEVGLSYSKVYQDSLTEHGAGSLNLAVDSTDSDALVTSLGVRIGADSPFGDAKIRPELLLRYDYDWKADTDSDHRVKASFAEVPIGSIDLVGQNRGRESVLMGVGTGIQLSPTLTAFAGGGYRWSDNGEESSFTIGIGKQF